MAAVTAAVVGAGAAVAGVAAANKASENQKQAMDQQKEAMDRQADIAERQQAMAEENWARYKEKYQPIEDSFVEESKGLGSIAKQNQAAAEARADVAGAFSRARDQLNRTPGSNPTSQAYLQEANRINLAEAATSAASQTGARRTQVDKGRAAMADVINMGKGLPANSAALLSGSAATAGSAANTANSLAANAGSSARGSIDAIGSFANALGGLSKNPTVQGWGTSLGNWASGGVSTGQIMQGGFGTGNSFGNQDYAQFI